MGAITGKLGTIDKPFLWAVGNLPAGINAALLREWLVPQPLGSTLIAATSKMRLEEAFASMCSIP